MGYKHVLLACLALYYLGAVSGLQVLNLIDLELQQITRPQPIVDTQQEEQPITGFVFQQPCNLLHVRGFPYRVNLDTAALLRVVLLLVEAAFLMSRG